MARDFMQFDTDMAKAAEKMEKYLRNDLLREVGHIGNEHFAESFDNEGFTDGGLDKWPQSKRKLDTKTKGAAATRKTLSGETSTLKNGSYYKTSGNTTDFYNEAEYAHVHNYGSREKVRVKSHTRRTRGGGRAKVRSYSYKQNIPQRRFAGSSSTMNRRILLQIKADFKRILRTR